MRRIPECLADSDLCDPLWCSGAAESRKSVSNLSQRDVLLRHGYSEKNILSRLSFLIVTTPASSSDRVEQ